MREGEGGTAAVGAHAAVAGTEAGDGGDDGGAPGVALGSGERSFVEEQGVTRRVGAHEVVVLRRHHAGPREQGEAALLARRRRGWAAAKVKAAGGALTVQRAELTRKGVDSVADAWCAASGRPD